MPLPDDIFMRGVFGGKGIGWSLREYERRLQNKNSPLSGPDDSHMDDDDLDDLLIDNDDDLDEDPIDWGD